jgi:hypothetical protein
VLEYLTHEGKIFVCPQFGGEGFDADFVALNFEDNPVRVEIVEVNSEAYKPNGLVKRLKWYQENGKRIMNSLMNQLPELKGLGVTESTPLVMRVFIQRRYVGWFGEHLNGLQNVHINSLDTVFESLLDWRKRRLASEG